MIHQFIDENDVVEYMEAIYQSCNLSMTVIVLCPGCEVDQTKVERLLAAADFPVGTGLLVAPLDNFPETAFVHRPDCVVVVSNGIGALAEVMNRVQATTSAENLRCTIVVL